MREDKKLPCQDWSKYFIHPLADDDPQKGGEAVLSASGPAVCGSEAVQGPAQGSEAVQGGAEDPQVGGNIVQGPLSPADRDDDVQGGSYKVVVKLCQSDNFIHP